MPLTLCVLSVLHKIVCYLIHKPLPRYLRVWPGKTKSSTIRNVAFLFYFFPSSFELQHMKLELKHLSLCYRVCFSGFTEATFLHVHVHTVHVWAITEAEPTAEQMMSLAFPLSVIFFFFIFLFALCNWAALLACVFVICRLLCFSLLVFFDVCIWCWILPRSKPDCITEVGTRYCTSNGTGWFTGTAQWCFTAE